MNSIGARPCTTVSPRLFVEGRDVSEGDAGSAEMPGTLDKAGMRATASGSDGRDRSRGPAAADDDVETTHEPI